MIKDKSMKVIFTQNLKDEESSIKSKINSGYKGPDGDKNI